MTRLRTKLLVPLVSVAMTLGFLEVVVRVARLAPEMAVIAQGRFKISKNPLIGYEMQPHYSYTGPEMRFYDYHDRSNNLGFRDRDHPVAKPAGTVRILVLGDSLTQGLGLPDHPEHIFTSVLERSLAAGGRRVEVLNFGVSGYNTQQEVHTLKDKGLVFKPDLVILAYCLNDTEMMNGSIIRVLHHRQTESKSLDAALLLPHLSQSALYRFIYGRWSTAWLPKELDARNKQLGENTVEPSFALLRQLGDAHGFKTLVAVFPVANQNEREEPYQFPLRLSAENRFESIDLRTTFWECAGGKNIDGLMADGLHPNQRGHECAGKALAQTMLDSRLISE